MCFTDCFPRGRAGDIAQTALHYEGGGKNNVQQVIGPRGFWNCTFCPHEYNLADRDAISALTNAEIYGGIDGTDVKSIYWPVCARISAS